MARRFLRTLLIAAVLAIAIPSSALTHDAVAATTEVGNSAEAWYTAAATVPTCTLPTGCPADPVPTEATAYPEGTLHIESVGGAATATSFLLPDLAALPVTASGVRAATLSLPVSEAPESGNVNVPEAEILACLATERIEDGVHGGTTQPPAFDCEAAVSRATYDVKAKAFRVDLTPFLDALQAGDGHGIALVPAAQDAPAPGWHVSLNGSRVEHGPKALTRIRYTLPREKPSDAPGPRPEPTPSSPGGGNAVLPPASSSGSAPATAGSPQLSAAPEAAPAPEAAAPPAAAAQPQAAPIALVSSPWYTYPGVVFLPLAFLVGLGVVGRSLTRPLHPLGAGARA